MDQVAKLTFMLQKCEALYQVCLCSCVVLILFVCPHPQSCQLRRVSPLYAHSITVFTSFHFCHVDTHLLHTLPVVTVAHLSPLRATNVPCMHAFIFYSYRDFRWHELLLSLMSIYHINTILCQIDVNIWYIFSYMKLTHIATLDICSYMCSHIWWTYMCGCYMHISIWNFVIYAN